MNHQLRSLLPVAAVAAALLAGCGGAAQGGTGQRAELIAKADPICRQSIKRLLAVEKTLAKAATAGPPLQALAASAPALSTFQSQAVSQLRRLTPPASLAGDWRSMLAGLQELADDTARIGVDAQHKNVKAMEKVVSTGNGTRKRLLAIGARDGLGPCGRAN
jgi:hypothetical protein